LVEIRSAQLEFPQRHIKAKYCVSRASADWLQTQTYQHLSTPYAALKMFEVCLSLKPLSDFRVKPVELRNVTCQIAPMLNFVHVGVLLVMQYLQKKQH